MVVAANNFLRKKPAGDSHAPSVEPADGAFALDSDDESLSGSRSEDLQREYDAISIFAAARLLCDRGAMGRAPPSLEQGVVYLFDDLDLRCVSVDADEIEASAPEGACEANEVRQENLDLRQQLVRAQDQLARSTAEQEVEIANVVAEHEAIKQQLDRERATSAAERESAVAEAVASLHEEAQWSIAQLEIAQHEKHTVAIAKVVAEHEALRQPLDRECATGAAEREAAVAEAVASACDEARRSIAELENAHHAKRTALERSLAEAWQQAFGLEARLEAALAAHGAHLELARAERGESERTQEVIAENKALRLQLDRDAKEREKAWQSIAKLESAHQEKLTALERNLEEARQRAADLAEGRPEDARAELAAAREAAVAEAVASERAEARRCVVQLEGAHHETHAALERRLAEARQRAEDLEDRLGAARAAHDATVAEAGAEREERERAQEEQWSALRVELALALRGLSSMEETLQSALAQRDATMERCGAERAELAELRGALGHREGDLERSGAEREELRRSMSAMEQKLCSLSAQRDAIARQHTQVERAEREKCASVGRALAEAQREMSRMSEELELASAERSALSRQMALMRANFEEPGGLVTNSSSGQVEVPSTRLLSVAVSAAEQQCRDLKLGFSEAKGAVCILDAQVTASFGRAGPALGGPSSCMKRQLDDLWTWFCKFEEDIDELRRSVLKQEVLVHPTGASLEASAESEARLVSSVQELLAECNGLISECRRS